MSSMSDRPHVAVLDYGLGNLFSIQRAVTHVGACVSITSSPELLAQADGVILPGVGAFGDGIQRLRDRGLVEPLLQFAQSGRPLMGICLGMQLLLDESEEFGQYGGLGLIGGKVVRLRDTGPDGERVKVPHIGWNELFTPNRLDGWGATVLNSLSDGDATYFVHSYVPLPDGEAVSTARINYGGHWYCAALEKENIIGVQFHPEKSGGAGLRILRNFVDKLSE